MNSATFTLAAMGISLLFFVGILFCVELGWRLAGRHPKAQAEGFIEGTRAFEAALFGLLGLLLAFTFSGAITRFDSRRNLVIQETNIIGTAYLRLEILPPGPREELKKLFRDYLDMRIETYAHLAGPTLLTEQLAETQALQKQIWDRAVAAVHQDAFAPSAILLLPILNEMIDITTTRLMWTRMHPPMIIFGLLIIIGLACSVVAGYTMIKGESRRWTHLFGFAVVLALTFYVIVDIEFPRMGLIRMTDFDQAMVDLRASMK